MADREVKRTSKNADGNITKLCNTGEYWSSRLVKDAISDIELKLHTYYVSWPEKRTEIHVVNGAIGKYLRTDRDSTTKNNLDDLPDC